MKQKGNDSDLDLVRRLVERLEHLSVDSTYAHRASGLRGSLLRTMARVEAGEWLSDADRAALDELTAYGYHLIELAAREIGAKRK